MKSRFRQFMVLLLSVGPLAASIAMVSTSPASANVCSPFPSCFGRGFQVSGTPDNSLTEWSNDPGHGGRTLGSVANGTTLIVACQANNGTQEDNKYNIFPTVPSKTWDFVWDGTHGRFAWVYDWWMNTPPQAARFSWYSFAPYNNPDGSSSRCNF